MAGKQHDMFNSEESKLRYEAYSQLQAAAVAFGESLPVPEIVVVGGQSDGKSSLLEAFLGFRFNVKDVEMGTRRPLIVQMVHDPEALQPRCRLQNEDSDEFGAVIMPETAVADAIRTRTESHLQKTGGTVSAVPIVLRAEYAYCPNLTLVDTPGFVLKGRKGESDSTPDDIVGMVKEQIAPPHRLVVFLQQSSVEWCSSLWMHIVQEVDPTFHRTIIVASKFDNRLKEFGERWEVDRFLSASGYLPPNVKPFFVALPKDRSINASAEWRSAIQTVDDSIFEHLKTGINGGFDEAKFGPRIGFRNLKGYLEDELARRYKDAAPGTLALLQERCTSIAAELAAAEAQLSSANDVAIMRGAAMQHAFLVANSVCEVLLEGVTDPDPMQFGLTTKEERSNCRSHPQWPGVETDAVLPTNGDMRLYGGAAVARLIEEFQDAAALLKMPAVAHERAANMLLALKARGVTGPGGASQAACTISRTAARQLLQPLLEVVCARAAFLLRRTFDIGLERAQLNATTGCFGDHPADASQMVRPYVAFHAAMRACYQKFVNSLEAKGRELLQHHLDAATSEFAACAHAAALEYVQPAISWEEGGENAGPDADSPGTQPAATQCREPLRESQMTVPETPSPLPTPVEKGRGLVKGAPKTASRLGLSSSSLSPAAKQHATVRSRADALFDTIRRTVATQLAPPTLKAAFLQPVTHGLSTAVATDLFARTDIDFMAMFVEEGTTAMLESRRNDLANRHDGLVRCQNEFAILARSL